MLFFTGCEAIKKQTKSEFEVKVLELLDQLPVLQALPGGVRPVVAAGGQSGGVGRLRVQKTARHRQQGGDLALQHTITTR